MDSHTSNRLIKLNKQFYQTFAAQFSATRERLQPGVVKILEMIPSDATILDLGCGNGELAHELARRGHQGLYLGLDFSKELLDVARAGCEKFPNISFAQADLSDPDWNCQLTIDNCQLTIIFAFSALHHLPGRELHLQTLRKVHALLAPNGRFIHSNWQFLNSPRLRARVQPWEAIGLTSIQVDPGDHLLDWRRGGYGLRYVHQFNADELKALAADSGFSVLESFNSDGNEGNLGLYQAWLKRET